MMIGSKAVLRLVLSVRLMSERYDREDWFSCGGNHDATTL